MNYSKRRKPAGESQRRGLRIVIIVVSVAVVIAVSILAVSYWLGPFPFGISRRDATLLTLWNEGRYADVLSQAEVVLENKPLDPQALTFGGFAHFYVGLDQATSVERDRHLQRAILLLRKAEHVGKAPLAAERSYVLGKAYYHTGRMNVDLAADYMLRALDAGYVADDSYSYLGLAYDEMGDLASSAEWFEEGISQADTAALRMKAADARSALGEYGVAEDHLRAALAGEIDGFLEPMLMIQLAAVLIDQDELQGAEDILVGIAAEYAESADAHYYLGVVYDRSDRPIEARSMWRTAVELDPEHVKALESLANWEG